MKRLLSHLLIPGEDHPDYPEENNVIARHQHIRRIEIFQILRHFRPAQRGERPQRGREPRIQRIRILGKMRAPAPWAFCRRLPGNYHLTALVTVISRNPVSPPQLTTDAPVADIIRPVKVSFIHTLGNQLNITVPDRLHRGTDQFVHLHEPLFLDHRLDGRLTAVMGAYVVRVVLDLHKQPFRFQFLHDLFSRLVAVQTRVSAAVFVDGSVVVHDIDFRQVMTLPDFEVVRVMSRRDLHHARTELHIHILVFHHRNRFVDDGQPDHSSFQISISLILRIHCHGGIAQHRLRTGGGKLQELRRAGRTVLVHQRILDMPEMTCLLLVLHFRIGNGRIAYRTPVDDPAALVDPAFFVHLAEHLGDRPVAALVHGKALPVPVAGRTHLFQLVDDAPAIFLLPLPGTFQESLAAQFFFAGSLLFQLLDNAHLGGNGSMIGARLPERIVPLHSFIADQNILHGIVQRMSHMQLSRDIRRRDNDGKRFLRLVHLGVEIVLVHPLLIQSVLQPLRVVGLCQFLAHVVPSCINPSLFFNSSLFLLLHSFRLLFRPAQCGHCFLSYGKFIEISHIKSPLLILSQQRAHHARYHLGFSLIDSQAVSPAVECAIDPRSIFHRLPSDILSNLIR